MRNKFLRLNLEEHGTENHLEGGEDGSGRTMIKNVITFTLRTMTKQIKKRSSPFEVKKE